MKLKKNVVLLSDSLQMNITLSSSLLPIFNLGYLFIDERINHSRQTLFSHKMFEIKMSS